MGHKHRWQDHAENAQLEHRNTYRLKNEVQEHKQILCAECGRYWTKMEVMAGEHLMVHDDTCGAWVCVDCL